MDTRIIETVLLEQKEELLNKLNEEYCTRPEEQLVDLESNLAQVIIGVRRSGKSTLCFNVIKKSDAKFAYVNFDDERLSTISASELNVVLECLYKIYGSFKHLFIDEIHRLNRSVEEVLYSAMEDYALDIIIGKGPSARSIRLDIARFTLIGATTRAGSLSAPLRDRFGVISKFEVYNQEELAEIIDRSAKIMGLEAEKDALMEMARCSRGTPRVANRLLKRIRDFSQVQGNGKIDIDTTKLGLKALGVDELGLEKLDRDILSTIINRFNGGPVGIDTIAASIGEEKVTIEDAYEPYLIQIGFISRTLRGRVVLPDAYRHLGYEYKD